MRARKREATSVLPVPVGSTTMALLTRLHASAST
jgi:hypothetical protein